MGDKVEEKEWEGHYALMTEESDVGGSVDGGEGAIVCVC